MRSQISVIFDCTDVVEDESAIATVVVHHDGRQYHNGAQDFSNGHFAIIMNWLLA